MAQAKGTFVFSAWDEKTWDGKDQKEVQGLKLTHAKIANTFTGDIEGTSELQYVMFYDDEGKAVYHGMEKITGTLGGKKGSFVMHTEGRFDGKTAGGDYEILPGSGTGELKGIMGKGSFVAQLHENNTPYTLEYRFE
jgi:hypothetical protein